MADEPIEDLLGAYALDAVDEHERRQVEAYLETDPRARAEVQELREVAAMLAVSSERPPEGLWDRIAGALEETPPTPGPELARVLPVRASRRRARVALAGIGGLLVGAAAAAAIAVAVVDDGRGTEQVAIEEAYDDALAEPGRRRAELSSDTDGVVAEAVVTESGNGFLAASSLPELPQSETYQLWGVYADNDVISLGVLGHRPQLEPFTADDDVAQLVITKEQAGGVISSTNPALWVGEVG